MRIRIVTLYYLPEVGAAQRRLSDLARRLAGLGHEVTVLTGFPNYPSGIKPRGYRGKFIMKEQQDGCKIIRLPHYIAPNRGFFKRLMIHLTFACSASLYSPFMKRDDIIYLESPPLFNGFIGLATKWLRRIPYLFNVADLWPQTAVELGLLNNRIIIKMAEFLERMFYGQASRILAITNGLRTSLINRGYPEEKVPLLTNGADHEVFRPDVAPNNELSAYRPEGGLLVIYAGTHGLIYSLETLLQAAKILSSVKIHFLFIGDGADKTRLKSIASELNLSNVTFLPSRPQDDMPGVFRAADVAVISLKDLPISKAILPVKCFEIMASGIPIILAARGEMAMHLETSQGGQVIDPENPDQLAGTLRRYMEMSTEDRVAIGRQGRAYVVENFSREKISRDLESIMLDITRHD
jgi:glycosyltransferase involved in cell wall biosynthesis